MKKLVSLLLSVGLILSLAAPAAAVNETREKNLTYRGIGIYLDGRELTPLDETGGSTEPFIMDSTTYLPIRAIAGALALGVEWIPETSTVALTSGGRLSISRAEPTATHAVKSAGLSYRGINISLDGRLLELKNADGDSVEPFIIDGTTYLPLRVIGEALGLTVKWDAATSSVVLLTPDSGHMRVVETLALDREGEMLLETRETLTYSYPRFTLVTERTGDRLTGERVTYFDAEGRPTEALYYGAEGLLSITETWSYGTDGLLKRFVHDEAEGSENDSCTLYEYKNGSLRRSQRFDGDTEPRVHSTDSTYTYDDKGNLIKLYVHLPMGSWEEIIYTYNENGLLTSESSVAYDILGGGFSKYSVSYEYDADGLLLRSVDIAGNVTEYYYGADGSLEKSVTARTDGCFVIKSYTRA